MGRESQPEPEKIMNPELFGGLAAFLTTAAYVPQAIKIFREKESKNISLGMYAMMSAGIFLWLVYGLMLGSLPLILANGTTFLLTAAILVLKLRHG